MIAALLGLIARLWARPVGRGLVLAGAAALALLAAWQFHVLDRSRAVAEARANLIDRAELVAAQAQMAALTAQLAAARDASARFEERRQVAEGEAARLAAELERYARETTVNGDCRVDDDFLGRLRSR